MYVCICNNVTDRDIRATMAQGERSFSHIRQALGIASGCGKCVCKAQAVIQQVITDCLPDEYEKSLPGK